MANSEHQHTTPFDERDRLPEELRQVARRYATLPVPRPTAEETSELIARLQASANHDLTHLPVHPPQRRRRVSPLLNSLAAILVVGILVGGFLFVLASRQHHPPTPSASVTSQPSPTRQTPAGTVSSLQTIHMIDATTGCCARQMAGAPGRMSHHIKPLLLVLDTFFLAKRRG